MSLMDAGVPLKNPVAGLSIGLVSSSQLDEFYPIRVPGVEEVNQVSGWVSVVVSQLLCECKSVCVGVSQCVSSESINWSASPFVSQKAQLLLTNLLTNKLTYSSK